MNRSTRWIFALGAAAALLLSGCAPKTPAPGTNPGNGGSQYGTEVPGGISSTGKYTGQDGVSASGIKMVYFSTDRYDVEPDQLQRIMSDMPKIQKLASSGKIRIEGNCDEMGTDEYNHALGLKRAKAVQSILVSNGIPSSRIDVVSYGESNPICTGHSAPCHAKNRRVEINKEN
ncbi:OmpA family protein [Nitratifractor salsuginis]|uniref:OmpA/MotB domain protein n=1 Tax=Nitratifractor salsuginis (strain DSM 16511 / JCM 12458 / E9I37-1) TaxID=749222 RepID=E6X368_NITSE|nr:OmpA family protein [Nitratifractor salsuginis]ADV46212.1 OmpA/MotB domain protein [Nitratifractor salsuginis DSM 16511]